MIDQFQFLYAVKEKIRTSSTLQFNPVYLQIPIGVWGFLYGSTNYTPTIHFYMPTTQFYALTNHFYTPTNHFYTLTNHFYTPTNHFHMLTNHFHMLTNHFYVLTNHFYTLIALKTNNLCNKDRD